MAAPFEIIVDGTGITPPWLTGVLRGRGTIGDDVEVASVSVEALGEAGGLLSDIYRTEVTYTGGTGPEAVIVKVPIPDETQRFTADVLGFYPRELAFYEQIADNAPFNTPAVYGSALAEEGTDFTLVLEDLGHLRAIDQLDGVPLSAAETTLTAMARFHAAWWDHPDIPAMSETFLPIKNDVYLAALPGVFDGGWGPCCEHGGDLLTPETQAFGDRFGSLVPWLLDSMSGPATFVHGDWRADNMFLDDNGDVTLIDFQISGFANGVYDVAYFLGQSVDSDVRSGNDEELLRHYLSVLADNGVDYSFEEAWRLYRTVLAHCFIYGVTSFQSWEHWNDRQKELMRTILRRSVRSIHDTDALAVLPSA